MQQSRGRRKLAEAKAEFELRRLREELALADRFSGRYEASNGAARVDTRLLETRPWLLGEDGAKTS